MNLLDQTMAAQISVATSGAIVLDAALKSIAVLAVMIPMVRCMRKWSAAVRHLALLAAIGSLLLLPILSRTLPGWNLLPRWLSPAIAASASSRPAVSPRDEIAYATGMGRSMTGRNWGAAASAPNLSATIEQEPGPKGALNAHPLPRPSARWLMPIWLIGVVCAALPTIAGLFSLALLRRKARIVNDDAMAQIVESLSAELGVRRRVALLATPLRRVPMTWGAIRPQILLPAEALGWPEDRQRVILLHELAHVQRCDFLSNLITQLACALYWFNPLVWLAARQIRREQEQACDDIVLGRGTKPASYAEEVLQMAAGHTLGGFEALGAVAMARPSSLEGRLLAILDRTRDRASLNQIRILTAGALMGLAIVPLSMLRAAQNVEGTRPAAAAVDPATNEEGLIAWWRGDGDGKDSAGKNDGAFPFGVRYAPGIVGKAFDFRRSYAIEDQLRRVSIKDSPEFELSEEMTLEAWVFPRGYGGIVLHRGDDRPGFDTWQVHLMTEGRIDYAFNAADNQGTSISAPIQLNQWQHVVVTFDHGAMKLFINGAVVAQGNTEFRPIATLDSRYDPAIGIGNTGGTNYSMPFDGFIDEVRIYNRALSAAEISERVRR